MLETIKQVAAAEGLSANAWVVRTLEQAVVNPSPKFAAARPTSAVADIEPLLNEKLDKLLDDKIEKLLEDKLAAKLAEIEERLGKLRA